MSESPSIDEVFRSMEIEDGQKWADMSEPEQDVEEGEIHTPKPCKFYNSRRGCRQEDKCSFLHERQVCAFFVSDQGCHVYECPFMHVNDAAPKVVLKSCPNKNCTNLCIGKQCMKCHSEMKRYNTRYYGNKRIMGPYNHSSSRHRQYRSREYTGKEFRKRQVRSCPISGCRNTCIGRRCRECHIHNRKSEKNYNYKSDDGGYHEETSTDR